MIKRMIILMSFIAAVALQGVQAQFILDDNAITEGELNGIWARETVGGDYTEILWFKEPRRFLSFTATGRITEAELQQIISYFNDESKEYPAKLEDGWSYYNYKVEVKGHYYFWKDKQNTLGATSSDYRIFFNTLFFSWGAGTNRPFTKLTLEPYSQRVRMPER